MYGFKRASSQGFKRGSRSHTHTRVFDSEFERVRRLEVFSKTANFWRNLRRPLDSPADFVSRNELEGFFCGREVGVLLLFRKVKTQSGFLLGENDLYCF